MTDCVRALSIRRMAALLTVALAVLASACTSPAQFRPASGAENFPPYEGEVKLLESMPASGQYARIGVVMVEGVQLTQDAAMVAAAKKKAAANGADAIVLQAPIKVSKDSAGGTKKTLAAWAIRLNR